VIAQDSNTVTSCTLNIGASLPEKQFTCKVFPRHIHL